MKERKKERMGENLQRQYHKASKWPQQATAQEHDQEEDLLPDEVKSAHHFAQVQCAKTVLMILPCLESRFLNHMV